jgi:hypothetical protein
VTEQAEDALDAKSPVCAIERLQRQEAVRRGGRPAASGRMGLNNDVDLSNGFDDIPSA